MNRMMSGKTKMILFVALLGITLLLIMFFLKPTQKEGFFTYYGPRETSINSTGQLVGNYDHLNSDRDAYVKIGKMKYNRFSNTLDVTRGNFIRSDDEGEIAKASLTMKQSMSTSDPTPSSFANTLLGLESLETDAELAPTNGMLQEAKKCEALRTRDSCKKLDDPKYSNCGICVKGGTPYSYENDGKHIGGMLLLPEDREEAKTGGTAYRPTIGECPEGFFFVDSNKCEIESNRLDCKEAGETGGFNGGLTVEGRDVVSKKCAQVPTKGDTTFIYEPKNRQFGVRLRVLAPVYTGICKVIVLDAVGTNQIGFGESKTPGQEFTIDIPSMREGETVNIVVALEVPYRMNSGKSEIFYYSSGYDETRESSMDVCRRIGASLATLNQMNEAINGGAQTCGSGWGADFVGWPAQARHNGGGCGSPGLSTWYPTTPNWGASQNKAGTWCYGVKPPESTKKLGGLNKSVSPFFGSYGNDSTPSQAGKPNIWSRWGGDYQAQFERGILLQWEMASGSATRTIPFEPTIVKLNQQGPTSTSSDGSMIFKTLRKFGTFNSSSTFHAPKPTGNSMIQRNQFWIWSNQPKEQQVSFQAKIPGVFLDTFYENDRIIGSVGPLITNPETAKLLRTSPCLKEGQSAGKYSLECLQNLYVGAGGDITNGKLVTNGGLSQLNKKGSMDEIAQYLLDLYSLATTGKDVNGNKVGANAKEYAEIVNDASQLLFGFDIATPCEDISEDAKGNIILTPKQGYKDADCLDWLWRNTGSDQNRFTNDSSKNIKNTYVTIGQRSSGLMNDEGTKESRSLFPFQTCQRSGSMSPLLKNGSPNYKAIEVANSKGEIPAIQDYYNSIFQTANERSSEDESDIQSEAVNQCYGISKVETPKSTENKVTDLGCWASSESLLAYLGDSRGNTEQERFDFCKEMTKNANIRAEETIKNGTWTPPKEYLDKKGKWRGYDIVGIRWGQCQGGYSYGPEATRYKSLGKWPDPKGFPTTKWGDTCDLTGYTAQIRKITSPSKTQRWWDM